MKKIWVDMQDYNWNWEWMDGQDNSVIQLNLFWKEPVYRGNTATISCKRNTLENPISHHAFP